MCLQVVKLYTYNSSETPITFREKFSKPAPFHSFTFCYLHVNNLRKKKI